MVSSGNAFGKNKRGYKRRRYVGRRKVTARAAMAAVRGLARKIKANTELKHYDAPLIFSAISSSGAVAQIDQIPQGDTETTRTGLRINPKSLLVRGEAFIESGGTYNNIRMIIFRWFDNASSPLVTDVLNTTGIAGLNSWNAPYSWASKPRYQVLYDRLMTVDANNYDTQSFMFKNRFKSKSKIIYNGSASTAVEWGNLFCLVISDSVAIAHPSINAFARLTFTDA